MRTVALARELKHICTQMRQGRQDWTVIEQAAMRMLTGRGWQPDYVAIRRRADLGEPQPGVELVAVAHGSALQNRLIDNFELDVSCGSETL